MTKREKEAIRRFDDVIRSLPRLPNGRINRDAPHWPDADLARVDAAVARWRGKLK